MWTVNIDKTAVEESSNRRVVVATMTDGTQTITKEFWVPSTADKGRLKSEIKTFLTSLDVAKTNPVTTGVLDLEDAPFVPTPAEQEQIDANKWFRQVNRLRAFKELQALGGMRPEWQADLDALALKVQADAKKVYLNNL